MAVLFEFAPMEGVTGYVFRNAYHRHFRPMDRYLSPFLSPKGEGVLSRRELSDVMPEHNYGVTLVPQILSNKAAQILCAADQLKDFGYAELNLNLGCPSPTVTSKGKGAALLKDPDALLRLLDETADGLSARGIALSIKTRIGWEDPADFPKLLSVFDRIPLAELTVHPRVRTDFYLGTPRTEWFVYAKAHSRHPLCYNGDLCGRRSFDALQAVPGFSHPSAYMFGRGALYAPWLTETLAEETLNASEAKRLEAFSAASCKAIPTVAPPALSARLRAFHDDLYTGYRELMSGEQPVLHKMKELWSYLIRPFGDAAMPCLKEIRKAKNAARYEAAVRTLFASFPPDPDYTKKN